MFWRCPKLFRYWSEILGLISQVFNFTIPKDLTVCLLGALDEETLTPSAHTAIIRLLYVARKLIARYWITSRVPTRQQWIDQVNKMLIREKLTYQHRKVPRKFYTLWQDWLDIPGLAPHQLVKYRLLEG